MTTMTDGADEDQRDTSTRVLGSAMTASSVDGVMCWASAARLVGFGGEYYNMMGIAHSSSSSSTYDILS